MSSAASTQRMAPEVASPENPAPPGGSEETRWRPVLNLPAQIAVDLPLPQFKVSDMLQLKAGSVLPTRWKLSRDLPLRVNGTLIGWCEFEVIGNRLAVRLTELI